MDYNAIHKELERQYYIEKKLDKETFIKLHAANWLYKEQEDIAGAKMADFTTAKGELRSKEIADELAALQVSKDALADAAKVG